MKQTLFITDGSVDQALSVGRWLESQPEPVKLTAVHAFAIAQPADQSLNAAVYREAKQAATEMLNRWVNFLPKSWPGQLDAELLPGDPELVLTIHLLLRRYDYLLIDGWQQGPLSTYAACQNQINTQLIWLSAPNRSSGPAGLIREMDPQVPTACVANQMPVSSIYQTVA